MDKKQVGAWALFDFANSVYPAVMTTAVFPFYYVRVIAGDGVVGESWWGNALSLSALIVAASSPLLGAIADRAGVRKRLMFTYVAACLFGVMMMSTLRPGMVAQGFVLFIVANVGFEGALVFYNAYLPDIAPPGKQGWVSGVGFGVGYLGSAVGLLMALPFREQIGVVWFLVAGFFLVFSIPAFLYLPKDGGGDLSIAQAARWGVTNFRTIVGEVWEQKELRNFLFAFFFYIDGVLTIIGMAGVVAAETFGFDLQGTIVLFLIVQFAALAGAFAFAKPTDTFGPKKILNGVLLVWIGAGVTAYFIQDPKAFYVLAIVAGLGLGSVQSASRSFMSSLIPEGKEAEMFGFYALCGKSSSVIGPAVFGFVTARAGGNQRPAFLFLTALFVIGLVLLQRVKDPKAQAA